MNRSKNGFTLMAYSHCTGTAPGRVQGIGLGAMGTNKFYRNVHTGWTQGKEAGSIVSYCAGPVPCTCLSPVPVLCE